MNVLNYSYLTDIHSQPIAGKPVIKKIPNNCGVILKNIWKEDKLSNVYDEQRFDKNEWENYNKPLQNFRFDLNAPMIGLRPTYSSYYRC